MATRQISTRWFLSVMFFCWFGAEELAVPQDATPSQTISGGAYKIAGIVESKTDAHLLSRARVTVRDAKDPQKLQSMITAEDGKFEFSGLPAGKYSLSGARRGFISASYEQHDQFSTAIVTGAGLDTENLMLRLAPDAVISGKVLDEFGDPVRHASMQLYYDDHSSGVDQIHENRGAQTDDQGAYEFTPLAPGTYFVSVNAKPWYAVHPNSEPTEPRRRGQAPPAPESFVDRSLDVAYPVTFYADVTDADSAVAIAVRGGDHLQVDIHLNPVPALRLLFRGPEDSSHGFNVPQLQQPAFDTTSYVQTDGARRVSPGLWEVTGVPAGRYNIRVGGGQESAVEMDGIDLSKDGQEIETRSGEALASVKVSVQVPAEPALPKGLMLGLRLGRRLAADWHAIDAKGEAEFQQSPGSYEVLVQASGKTYSIAHIAAEGGQVSGHTLTLAPGSSPSLSLTLVGGSVEVQGTAKKSEKAFAGAMVVLVPKDPEVDHGLFRRDQSDLDGTFLLRDVVPGSYTLLAIENGWDLDWSQPSVIAAYLKHGRKVQVGGQAGSSVNVAEPIAVQSR